MPAAAGEAPAGHTEEGRPHTEKKYMERIQHPTLRKVRQQSFLLGLLVRRNIKNQYYRSFIGVLWTVLNPLLNMLVMWFVFSNIFGRDMVSNLPYPLYLLSGNIIFAVMRGSTSSSLTCLVGQRDMLQKTRVSITLFPTANVLSALVTFGFSFIALLLVAIILACTGQFTFHWQILLVIVLLPALTLFSLGLSYFLGALYVFFRDLKHLYGVLLTLWTYLTPLFYTVDRLDERVGKIIAYNPMYHYVSYFRDALSGAVPGARELLICYAFGVGAFLLGYAFLYAVRNRIAANL